MFMLMKKTLKRTPVYLLCFACLLVFTTISSITSNSAAAVDNSTTIKSPNLSKNLILPNVLRKYSPVSVIQDMDKIKPVKVADAASKFISNMVVTKLQADVGKAAKTKRTGTILVLVNRDIYPDIKGSINIYTDDLALEGYTSLVYTVSGNDPIQLKSFIREFWLKIYSEYNNKKIDYNTFKYGTGAFLIGELPVPLVHSRIGEYEENGVKKPYEGTFVCDLYLTDMNGYWNTLDDKGVPFISTVDPAVIAVDSECTVFDFNSPKWKGGYKLGNGGAKPEIWIGRLGSRQFAFVNGVYKKELEVNLLTEYFKRNHAYRHGTFPTVPHGESGEKYAARDRVVYYDDPWVGFATSVLGSITKTWPDPVYKETQLSNSPCNIYISTTSGSDPASYVNRISNYSLWVEFLAHSNPWYHEFVQETYNTTKKEYEWTDVGWISCDSLLSKPINTLFFYLQGCDACDYRQERNIGGTYLLKGNTLAVLGNTTVGPHDNAMFYMALSNGASVGAAQMIHQQAFCNYDSWPTNLATGAQSVDPKRYYGQTLLGDPTLKPVAYIPKSEPVSLMGTQDYIRIATVAKNIKANSSIVGLVTQAKQQASKETRKNMKSITKMPSKGFDYLRLDIYKPVIDPQITKFLKPLKRVPQR